MATACFVIDKPRAAMPAHIVTQSVTARGVLNMTAVAVVDAQSRMKESG